MRGLLSLLLALLYLPLFAVGVPGILLFRTCSDGDELGALGQETGLYEAALADLERLGEQDPALRRLPEPTRRALFAAIREAAPPEFFCEETVRFHASLTAWIARPVVPLDYTLDLAPMRERATKALIRSHEVLAAVPDCEDLQTPEQDGCLPMGLGAESRAEMLVALAFRELPPTIDVGAKLSADALDELAELGELFSLAAALEVVAWILLLGLPLLVLLINLNHPGRMLRRVGLMVLIPALLTTTLVHLSELVVGMEIAEQSEQLAREEQTPLEFSEAGMMAAGQRLTQRLFSAQQTTLYVIDGAALLLVLASLFVGAPRRRPASGAPVPPGRDG